MSVVMLLVTLLTWTALIGWIVGGAWIRARRLRQEALIHALATLIGRDLPLLRGLTRLSMDESSGMSRALERLTERLARGDSLSAALRDAHWGFSSETIGAINAAERAGTLATTLRELANRPATGQAAEIAPSAPYRIYLFMLCGPAVLALITAVRFVFVDMGDYDDISLPSATVWLMEVGAWVYDHLVWVTAGLLSVMMLCVYAWVRREFAPRQPDYPPPRFPIGDALRWWMPLVGRVERATALARQTPILAASIHAGHDIVAAARHAAEAPANHFARRTMRDWADAIETGETPMDAARRVGIAAPLRRALSAPPDRVAGALAYVAKYYESLRIHWARVLEDVTVPLMILAAAAFVGFVVIGLYLPIVSWIDDANAAIW
ncbi:MAG: type II secretion system F family protein [Phycisphaerales bacterium]|nr:type II secretion system F family protein [Phycisphaerales bacterium]